MLAYYNEIDPYCAQWLRNLIQQNLIAPGVVDERDIRDVKPYELAPYRQCHFFAGIGGWSCALRLAAVADHREIWTGSCPCQPFSAAGFAGGFDDERHLWPAWQHLIAQRKPATIFGEQVASKLGLQWLDLVQADLENQDYAVGASDLCAAGVGAPHIRQRLWFVADASGDRSQNGRLRKQQLETEQAGCERDAAERSRCSPWADLEWLACTDGKARPVEPGTFPLAHGIPSRVGRLRAYGNAIVPQVAAEFIKAALTRDTRVDTASVVL